MEVIYPPLLSRKEVTQQYTDLALAIVRELIQNSLDAGAKNIYLNFEGNTYSAQDDGRGMDRVQFQDRFLTLGATHKETGSIGGFGAAKKVLAFAYEKWECASLDFSVKGSFDQIIEVSEEEVGGFFISATDELIEAEKLERAAKTICDLSHIDINVYVNGRIMAQGRELQTPLGTTPVGNVFMYVAKRSSEPDRALLVRANGLFMFMAPAFSVVPSILYLDLTVPSTEAFTENRESLRWNVSSDIRTLTRGLLVEKDKVKRPTITFYGVNGVLPPKPEPESDPVIESTEVVVDQTPPKYVEEATPPVSATVLPETVDPEISYVEIKVTDDEGNSSIKTFVNRPSPIPYVVLGDTEKDYTELAWHLQRLFDFLGVVTHKPLSHILPGILLNDALQEYHSIEWHGRGYAILAVNPDLFKESPIYIMDQLVHVYAHVNAHGHYSTFEHYRSQTVKAIGVFYSRFIQYIMEAKQ